MTDDTRNTFPFDFNPDALGIMVECLLGAVDALKSDRIRLRVKVIDLEKENRDLKLELARLGDAFARQRTALKRRARK